MKLYEVGGCVRDELLGMPTKDVDFVCIAESYAAMKQQLVNDGFVIYVEKPEMVTIRCSVPPKHPLRVRAKDADFVLARKDAPTGDGRRPDYVEPGTLADDLARRDFTVNAIAKDPLTGEIIDFHNGLADLKAKTIRFVGDPAQRIREDGLRVLRGFRFSITKGFSFELQTEIALYSEEAAEMLGCVSVERVREELEKMFMHDSLKALNLLASLPERTQRMIFRESLRLSATMRAKK